MSWQSYVDISLVGSGKIAQAAIFSIEDNGVLSASPGFSPAPGEIQTLSNGFADPSPFQPSEEVHIAGVKYKITNAGSMGVHGNDRRNGFCAMKTNKTVLLAVYEPPMSEAHAVITAKGLADYLISQEY